MSSAGQDVAVNGREHTARQHGTGLELGDKQEQHQAQKRFNIDAASVELRSDDGSTTSIYTPEGGDDLCPTVPTQTEAE